jgi:hypothetical protein
VTSNSPIPGRVIRRGLIWRFGYGAQRDGTDAGGWGVVVFYSEWEWEEYWVIGKKGGRW